MLYTYTDRETGALLFHCIAFDLGQANRECLKQLEAEFGDAGEADFPTPTWTAAPMTLKQTIEAERSYFFHPVGNGKVRFEPPTEFDGGINAVTREKIAAYAREHQGTCWLGNINRYEGDRGKPYLVQFTGELVYNFEYRFAIPAYDQELVYMIKEREQAPYTGTAGDYPMVQAIFDRIEQLSGIALNWV